MSPSPVQVVTALMAHVSLTPSAAEEATDRVDKCGEADVYVGPGGDAGRVATLLRASGQKACGLLAGGLLVTVESPALRADVPVAVAVTGWLGMLANLSDAFGRVIALSLCIPFPDVLAYVLTPASIGSPMAEEAPGYAPALAGAAAVPLPPVQPLSSFLQVDPDLPKDLCQSLHALYMSIMKDSVFRQYFALGVAHAFPALTSALHECRGPMAGSLFDFGVHIFTVHSIVNRLVFRHGFASLLLQSFKVCGVRCVLCVMEGRGICARCARSCIRQC